MSDFLDHALIWSAIGGLYGVIGAHIWWCQKNERQRGKIIEFLKLKAGYEE